METNIFLKSWKQSDTLESAEVVYGNSIVTLGNLGGGSGASEKLDEWEKKAPVYKTADIATGSDTWELISGTLKSETVKVRAHMPFVEKNIFVFQRNRSSGAMAAAFYKNQGASNGIQIDCYLQREMYIIATSLDNTKILGVWYVNNYPENNMGISDTIK